MDSISRPEFAGIFHRVSLDIDLKYCTSALAIEQALIEARSRCKAKSKISRTAAGRARYGRRAEWLDTLIESDFAGRAIFEAHRNPHGIIAMTLIYEREEAQQRILAQRRAQLRARITYGAAPRVPAVPKTRKAPKKPWFRRISTHRR